jgi:5-deoxy-glucuronate isomerase
LSDTAYAGTHVGLEIRNLDAGTRGTLAAPPSDEAAVVLLSGDIDVADARLTRDDVFHERASAVYLPPGVTVDVHARASTELAYITTRDCELTPSSSQPAVVNPDDVVVHERGRAPWARQVHDVVADAVAAQRLLIGETFNEPGQWSSFPPHKHDGRDGEAALEEVYYFRFDQPAGFGFQGLYEADGDERAVFLRHGTIVGIPRGYHPVCAAPGYRLYYLWALVGAQRQLAMHEDPAHRWLARG